MHARRVGVEIEHRDVALQLPACRHVRVARHAALGQGPGFGRFAGIEAKPGEVDERFGVTGVDLERLRQQRARLRRLADFVVRQRREVLEPRVARVEVARLPHQRGRSLQVVARGPGRVAGVEEQGGRPRLGSECSFENGLRCFPAPEREQHLAAQRCQADEPGLDARGAVERGKCLLMLPRLVVGGRQIEQQGRVVGVLGCEARQALGAGDEVGVHGERSNRKRQQLADGGCPAKPPLGRLDSGLSHRPAPACPIQNYFFAQP